MNAWHARIRLVQRTGKPHLFKQRGAWWVCDVHGRLFPALGMDSGPCG